MIIDCHYCEYATCENPTSWCNCNVEDGGYFDHEVKDSKKEAEEQHKLFAIAFNPEDRGGFDAYNAAIEIVKEEGGLND